LLVVIAILLALILLAIAPELVAWLFKAGLAVAGVIVALGVAFLLLENATVEGVIATLALLAVGATGLGLRKWLPGVWRILRRAGRYGVGTVLGLTAALLVVSIVGVVRDEGFSTSVFVLPLGVAAFCWGAWVMFRDDPPADDPTAFTTDPT
jgi:hypothetical protein